MSKKSTHKCSGASEYDRDPCVLCCLKHLSQAYVLLKETHKGYPHHQWIAMGHMAEAEDEVLNAYSEVSTQIRLARLRYQNEGIEPNLLGLIDFTIDADNKASDKKLAQLGYK